MRVARKAPHPLETSERTTRQDPSIIMTTMIITVLEVREKARKLIRSEERKRPHSWSKISLHR